MIMIEIEQIFSSPIKYLKYIVYKQWQFNKVKNNF